MSNSSVINSEQIEAQEERDEAQSDLTSESQRVRYANQTYDIDGLVRRLTEGDIVIPRFREESDGLETDGFQRDFVWNKNQMDQFIESILIGYPIPGIFLVEQKDEKLLVLDGQQRLTTLRFFKEGKYPAYDTTGKKTVKDFTLTHISDEFKGKSYADLDPIYKRKLNNTNIAATVVRTIPIPGNQQAIYEIFARINSGGTQLTAHEIRIASYAGPLVGYIDNINRSNEDWRSIYGKEDNRLRDHELISRIFAMYLNWKDYKRPLKRFVNEFYEVYTPVVSNKEKDENLKEKLDFTYKLFCDACSLIKNINLDSLRPSSKESQKRIKNPLAPFTSNKNFAWSDALFVGVMTKLSVDPDVSPSDISNGYIQLLNEKEAKYWSTATSDKANVFERMEMAMRAFKVDDSCTSNR